VSIKIAPIVVTAAFILAAGCGRTRLQADTWLAMSDADTVTVLEASEAWQAFGDEQRAVFADADSVGPRLVRSLAMADILANEAAAAGYSADPGIEAFGRAWLRIESAIAWSELMLEGIEAPGQDELDDFLAHPGELVWLTCSTSGADTRDLGGFRRAELPLGLALALDSAPAGEFVEHEDLMFRLDSASSVDPSLTGLTLGPDGLPDSSSWWAIDQGRLRFWSLTTQIALWDEYGVAVDTAAVDRLAAFYAGTGPLASGDTLLSSAALSLTAMEMLDEVAFFQTRVPLRPDSRAWLIMAAENILMQGYQADLLQARDPALYDSLAAEARDYAMGLAVDSMRADSVLTGLAPSEEQILAEYDSLGPVSVPERRVLRAVLMSPDLEPSYEVALEGGTAADFIGALPPIPAFVESESSRVTKPLSEADLPPGHGEPVFAAAPGDTSWIGPLLLDETRGSAFYRVLEAVPSHVATPDELMPTLEARARERLEMESTEAWLDRLSERHGLRYNSEVLSGLPGDPGEWPEFIGE
jgi:hypothetical protein